MRYPLAFLALGLIVSGCALKGPDENARRTFDPASLEASRSLAGGGPTAAWPTTEWWRDLGDPQLDRLIERALAGSPTLSVAQARLRLAQSLMRGAESALYPEAGVNLDMTRQRFSEEGLAPPPIGGSVTSQNRLAIDFIWNLDLWGRSRAAVEAAVGRTKATEVDVFAARLALSTAVARSYVQLKRLYDQLAVLRETLRHREEVLGLTRKRYEVGIDTQVEVQQASAAVPSAKAEIQATEEAIALTRHQIAALTGGGPDAGLDIPSPALAEGGRLALPSQLGADLIGRRPDVVAQRWRVEAAAADIKVARGAFYPNVNLLGFLGFSSIGIADFLSRGAVIYGLGPAVQLPLYQGGRLQANLDARGAEYDLAVEQYNQTLVDAIRDVTDQVASLRSIAAQRVFQREALEGFQRAYRVASLRYREGVGNYLAVLISEVQVLAQQRIDVDLRARELDTSINLVRALGGGYVEPPQMQSRSAP